uniref:IS1380 family transposase n=1 Tax=Roseivirga sp. TaxID=1964215 RepID=UPI00404780E9
MKVVKSNHINPFGGINFVIQELDSLGLGGLLNEELPSLAPQSRYDWRDLLYSFWSIFFCGGDCSEDLAMNLRGYLSNHPHLKVPSPDRLLNRMKGLASPSVILDTARGKRDHHFSMNTALNSMNIKLIKKALAKQAKPVVLDYDNTIVFTNKADARNTYQYRTGYMPGVGIIGDKVVYVENRNGNSGASVLQDQTLNRMFELLDENGVRADIFRADSASYQLSCLSMVCQYVDKFYIKARMSDQLQQAIGQISEWKEFKVGGRSFWRGSTWFTPFEPAAKKKKQTALLTPCRLVITKERRADGQINLFTKEAYNYHPIITNDKEKSDDEVFYFYNQRGAVEKEFDVLKNDFGWNNMPFSVLEQNTVYLLLTAMCRNLYALLINTFSQKCKALSPHFRIKKFIFRFICTPAKWVKGARSWKLRMYTKASLVT